MMHRRRVLEVLVVVVGLIGSLTAAASASAGPSPVTTAAGFPRSQNIALVPDAGGRQNNGGVFPTSGFPNSYAPTFTDLSVESIRDNAVDPLATGFDTVVLNGICDIAGFLSNPQFKSRIEGFASRGGKLLIWDSECTSTDYTGFAIPFTTNNPGANGAQGTLTDAEDNTLSSTNASSPSYVDLNAVATLTDAVGDANVFTTFDGRWFLDLKATNVSGVNGAAQAYANLGKGIVIYNGLDKDFAGGNGFDPASTDGATHLDRIWMLDLLQPWSPDGLPHSNPVVGNITVSPSDGPVGTSFTFKYSCPRSKAPQLTILDSTGRSIAQGFTYGIPVSGNGRDYVQTITMRISGSFSATLRCGGAPSGSVKFTVKAPSGVGKYVALGDSFSAGEGTFSYDTNAHACHRGPLAWPRQLEADSSKLGPIEHKACTGAVTTDFYSPQKGKGVSAQIPTTPQLDVGLVTFTIGGNDADFAKILAECFLPGSCVDAPDRSDFLFKLATLTATLKRVIYPRLAKAYPNARIVHVGYPRLTPLRGSTPINCAWLDADEQDAGDSLVHRINGAIQSAVKGQSRVEYADATDALRGHELCTASSWVNPLFVSPDDVPFTVKTNEGDTERGHPNRIGQKAYEIAVSKALGL